MKNTEQTPMQVVSLNIYRQPADDVNVLRNLVKEHITDKGGKLAFDWSMQQCGYSLWYDCIGYIGDNTCVTIRYTSR